MIIVYERSAGKNGDETTFPRRSVAVIPSGSVGNVYRTALEPIGGIAVIVRDVIGVPIVIPEIIGEPARFNRRRSLLMTILNFVVITLLPPFSTPMIW